MKRILVSAITAMAIASCTKGIPEKKPVSRVGDEPDKGYIEIVVDTTVHNYEFEIEVEYLKGGGNG